MVDIYGLNIEKNFEYLITPNLWQYVSLEKKRRLNDLINQQDIQLMLGADLLIRAIACKYLNVKNEQLDFRSNEYGKPYIYGCSDFNYNLSHSGKWVVCAVDRQPIGIDVESVAPVDLDIARTFFSPEEVEYIMGRPEVARTGLFYDYWTLKESYIKALGYGLSKPLNSFIIELSGDGKARIKDAHPEVFLRLYKLDQEHRLSVCAFNNAFATEVTVIDMQWINNELRR